MPTKLIDYRQKKYISKKGKLGDFDFLALFRLNFGQNDFQHAIVQHCLHIIRLYRFRQHNATIERLSAAFTAHIVFVFFFARLFFAGLDSYSVVSNLNVNVVFDKSRQVSSDAKVFAAVL